MKTIRKTKACSLCGSGALAPQFSLQGYHFFRCRNCGLIQMIPLPCRESGRDDYTGYDLEKQRRFVRLFWIPQYERALGLIRRFKKRGNLLDVGCGTGEFLEVAERAGFTGAGIEPSETAARIARTNHPVIQGELEDARLAPASFDVVTLWSVLEHVGDPSAFLERIKALLKDDGLLALRIPSSQGLLPILAHGIHRLSAGAVRYPLQIIYQLDWNYPHVFFYNPKNAGLLLRKCGFEVVAARRESSFDVRSLDLRMDYMPADPALRLLFKTAMFAICQLGRIFSRQDEIVLVARKAGSPPYSSKPPGLS
ncbi:MAG: class I SAM-dependent methyltransferase [Candidatus Aminicenantales bacterium]